MHTSLPHKTVVMLKRDTVQGCHVHAACISLLTQRSSLQAAAALSGDGHACPPSVWRLKFPPGPVEGLAGPIGRLLNSHTSGTSHPLRPECGLPKPVAQGRQCKLREEGQQHGDRHQDARPKVPECAVKETTCTTRRDIGS